ncbi:hypothetical protein NESM_000923900 [Novymonas esmeraldas]|uniref:Uncharacterized protein n=1 Tax=Novymonas esmeraldas TaxID=1808958 RepID=A0AAW0F105_9TRYP
MNTLAERCSRVSSTAESAVALNGELEAKCVTLGIRLGWHRDRLCGDDAAVHRRTAAGMGETRRVDASRVPARSTGDALSQEFPTTARLAALLRSIDAAEE